MCAPQRKHTYFLFHYISELYMDQVKKWVGKIIR